MIETLLSKGLGMLVDVISAKGQTYIEEATGVKLSPTMSQAEILELQKWQATNQLELERIILEHKKLDVQDEASARDREVAIAVAEHAPLLNKIITPLLALLVVIGGGVMLAVSPEPDVRTSASNLMVFVLGYYFGTSASSKNKDELLKGLVK